LEQTLLDTIYLFGIDAVIANKMESHGEPG